MSDFGSGYATCLIQFVNHWARLDENVEYYARLHPEHPDLFSPASAAEIWANGASDHLYEIARPEGLARGRWAAAKVMADRAVSIGHGFSPSSRSDPDECRLLLSEAEDLLLDIGVDNLAAALAWDTAHGLKPDKGEWSCSENLRRTDLAAAR